MKKINYCKECGEKVIDGEYCPVCGEKLNDEVEKMEKRKRTNKILLVIIAITIIAGVLMVSTAQSNYNVEKMLLSNEKGSAWVNTTNNFKSINNGYMEKHNDEQFTIVKAFDLNKQDDIQSLKNITEIANKGKKYTDDSVVYYTVDYETLGNQMNAWGITTLVLKDKEVNIGFMYDNDTNICVVVISNNFQHVEKMLKTVDFEVGGDFHKGTQDLTRMYISTAINNNTTTKDTTSTTKTVNTDKPTDMDEQTYKAICDTYGSYANYQKALDKMAEIRSYGSEEAYNTAHGYPAASVDTGGSGSGSSAVSTAEK